MRKLLFCIFLIQFSIIYTAFAQNFTVKGKVVSEDTNEALPGVSVKIKGMQKSVQTSSDGGFTLQVKEGNTLEFVYVGYASKQVIIQNNTPFITVKLSLNYGSLDEVVVTGYSREKRQSFAGAATILTASHINQVPVGSFEHVMQGQLPGVYVTAGSGQPGSAARVIVRGVGTINNSTNPLFIIDNVPVEPTINYGINPSDIESITLLKDASTTALYGSRGSNGVVLVTTKKGKQGDLRFNYKTQFGIGEANTSKYSMMNTAQRLQFEEEVGIDNADTWKSVTVPGWNLSPNNPANISLTQIQKDRNAEILDSIRNINTNWLDVFFRTGKFQEHEVSGSGGSEKVRFYSSVNYYNQEGIGERSFLKRYFFRTNLDFNENRLSGSVNLGFGYTRTSGVESESSNSSYNPFASAYFALPYEQPYINGTLYHPGNIKTPPNTIWDAREGASALVRLQDATSASDLTKTLASASLQYKLTKDLTLNTIFGFDFRDVNFVRNILSGTYFGSLQTGEKGSYNESLNRNLGYISTSGVNYSTIIGEKHGLELKALFELNRTKFKSISFTGFGINPRINESPIGIPTSATSIAGGRKTQNAMASFIGMGKYSFDDRYIVNFNSRYDGASAVSAKNRWNGFYSGALLWNAHKESFLADVSALDLLQLRLSYGKTASSQVFGGDNFISYSTYDAAKYAGGTGIVAGSPGNENFNWEITHQFNAGLNTSLLKNRINVVLDWYNKISSQLYIDQPLSATSGFTAMKINAGKIRNQGIEGELTLDVVKEKDFLVRIGGNFNYNANKVLDLGQLNEFIVGTTMVREGLPFGSQYAVKWAGVDPATGDALYYDRNGNKTNIYDSANQSITGFGSYIPPMVGGFSAKIDYKIFSLQALFSFADNYYRFNNEPLYNESPSFGNSNKSTTLLNRWRKAGDITDVQRYDRNSTRRLSSKDIEDASYVRFRNLRIGLAVPEKIMSKLKVKHANLYLQGQNLYTWTKWTGFDPEDNNNISSFEYPTARTYTLGLNVNF